MQIGEVIEKAKEKKLDQRLIDALPNALYPVEHTWHNRLFGKEVVALCSVGSMYAGEKGWVLGVARKRKHRPMGWLEVLHIVNGIPYVNGLYFEQLDFLNKNKSKCRAA